MTPGPDHFTLINAARVLDGSGGPPTEPAALLIADERIVRLGSPEEVRPPEGARVARVDYGAATVLPGLVDAHTHLVSPGDGTAGDDVAKEDDGLLLLQAAKNARTLLHSGVTTLRENGAKGRVAFALREGVRRQLAPGPRMVICGRPQARRALDARVEGVRRMTAEGVRMCAGSDSPWGWYAPGEFVHEIEMLAGAGLSNSDAIVAGTAGAADSIGVGAVAGRLAPGRQADLLVVRGDPTRDLGALWDVLDVYQAGRRVLRGLG